MWVPRPQGHWKEPQGEARGPLCDFRQLPATSGPAVQLAIGSRLPCRAQELGEGSLVLCPVLQVWGPGPACSLLSPGSSRVRSKGVRLGPWAHTWAALLPSCVALGEQPPVFKASFFN